MMGKAWKINFTCNLNLYFVNVVLNIRTTGLNNILLKSLTLFVAVFLLSFCKSIVTLSQSTHSKIIPNSLNLFIVLFSLFSV